ncbi:MAG: hypothetical protein FWB86_13680, partial [Treponema sp.]|nr:hypothetical protein [Treponema sp.]
IIVALLILVAFVGSASAFDFLSAADGIKDSSIFINLGVGFGVGLYSDIVIPPVQASVEYLLPIGIPLSVGGFFEMGMWTNNGNVTTYVGKYDETRMAFGGKVSWHVDLGLKNLDLYVSLKLGYMLWSVTNDYTDWSYSSGYYRRKVESSYDDLFYGFALGARYFFTDAIGIYLEAGYSLVSFVNLGLAVKF